MERQPHLLRYNKTSLLPSQNLNTTRWELERKFEKLIMLKNDIFKAFTFLFSTLLQLNGWTVEMAKWRSASVWKGSKTLSLIFLPLSSTQSCNLSLSWGWNDLHLTMLLIRRQNIHLRRYDSAEFLSLKCLLEFKYLSKLALFFHT